MKVCERELPSPVREEHWIGSRPDEIRVNVNDQTSEETATYNAYCIAPSFFSWLGNGTSLRGFPVTLSGGPWISCDLWISVADLAEEEEMSAEGPARKGRRVVDGFTTGFCSVFCRVTRS